MTERIDYGREGGVLNYVHEGMTVYDADDEQIGTVQTVYFGTMGVEEGGVGTGPVATGDLRDIQRTDSWMHRLGDVLELEPDFEMPEEMAERLLRRGFIRVDSDRLLGSDSFVFPDQIESASEEGVRLNVNEDDLLKKRDV